MKTYACIGNRVLPAGAEDAIRQRVEVINAEGSLARTGGAPGADSLFEKYAKNCIVYLPWKGFNHKEGIACDQLPMFKKAMERLYGIFTVERIEFMSAGSRKLYVRNLHILLGIGLDTPVDLVIAYNNQTTGGTVATIEMARSLGIKVEELNGLPKVRE